MFDFARAWSPSSLPVESEKFLYRRLSPKSIWDIANSGIVSPENARAVNYGQLYYSPSGSFSTDYKKIKYNYSLTELLPREYTKYAFESYFSMNDENKAAENAQKKLPSISWFEFITLKNLILLILLKLHIFLHLLTQKIDQKFI
ncbi:hypothetical protein NW739_02630 [Mycoplasmopsis felis]|uniref:hypothetical protein n=1 Tax=Mycoplasmopsis felis TaxID=33923 RepID=UPI0021DF8E64|nr:hypothetical protein [Mycoplasmopsis felis]MCU9939669.1 hypothetical protein [Mycoplasmopsis felis]